MSSNPPPPTPFFFGGIASAMAAACTHPLDLLKVRLQTSSAKDSMIRNVTHIVKNESVVALFNGLSASLLRQLTYSTARFGVYEEIKRRMTKDGQQLSMSKSLGAAIFAGAVGGVCGNPSDVVNVRMQNDGKLPIDQRKNYKHAIDGLLRITREEGATSLFRGVSANIGRAMLMNASQIGSYEQAKGFLVQKINLNANDISTHFCASLMAGLVATTVSSPVDVVKTRIMSSSKGAQAETYNGLFDAFVKIITHEGPSALFKGWVPSFVRLGPQTILTFVFLEQMKIYYRNHFY